MLRLDFLPYIRVFEAAVRNILSFFQKADGTGHVPERRRHRDTFGDCRVLPSLPQAQAAHRLFVPEDEGEKQREVAIETVPLEDLVYANVGMVAHANEKLCEAEPGLRVKYLLAVMNSSVTREWVRARRRSNTHLYREDWKPLPIPVVPASVQSPVVKLADQILVVRKANPNVGISDLKPQLI